MSTTKAEAGRIGKRGVYTIPSALRRRYGLEDGSLVVAEEREDGILIRPAVAMPIEIYTDERIAEFLLSNAVTDSEYAAAREEVRGMGLDPDAIPHFKPKA